jgi:hypothetical protein
MVRQQMPRFTDDVANMIEILLERLKAHKVVNDWATLLVKEDGVLRSCEVTVVSALARHIRKHVQKRPVAGCRKIFPAGDESIPWVSDNGKTKITGRGGRIFRAQHPIVHEVPVRMGAGEIKSVDDRRSGTFSLVDENAFIGVTDHRARRSRSNGDCTGWALVDPITAAIAY